MPHSQSHFRGPRNRLAGRLDNPIGRTGPIAYVAWRASTSSRVVVPARQAGNRFLGPLKDLQIRAQESRIGRACFYAQFLIHRSGAKSFDLFSEIILKNCNVSSIFQFLLKFLCWNMQKLFSGAYLCLNKCCRSVNISFVSGSTTLV